MPGPHNTLLIEGGFRELAEELSDYIDNLRKTQNPDASTNLKAEVTPLLEQYTKAEEAEEEDAIESARDAALQPIVNISAVLNGAPEKEFIAAYNLLIHLIHLSPNVNQYLQPICKNLSSTDMGSSATTTNRFSLALSVLSTIFNVLDPDDSVRYPVFNAILDVVSRSGNFETLRPQLKHLDQWLQTWQTPVSQQRRMYLRISQLAKEGGQTQQAYEYMVRALRTVSSKELSGDEARKLSTDAVKMALDNPTHFDLEDLTSLDAVQSLRQSEPIYYQLLETFTAQTLEDYNDFKEEHRGWVEKEGLNDDVLIRKMRLLTLASLAASSGQARSLPYATICKGLQIPSEDVEMWVIDVIRAGLVEGKLSQLNQTFLIHRSTYRVFSESQWREVAGRLDMWRASLIGVLEVVRAEKENIIVQKEQELKQMDSKLNGGYRRARNNDTMDMSMD